MPFSPLWPAFMLTVRINALYDESVQRQEQHSSGNYYDYVTNIDLIAVENFRVGQTIMKSGTLQYDGCRHRSVNSESCTAVEEEKHVSI